jgi:DNA-binding transcriptional ArsR family regulator
VVHYIQQLPNEPLVVDDMTDERISSLRATAHPLRLRMLSLLTSSAMSAAEVARELGITHANASYHLRQLHDADLVVVEGEERIRGGVAKRYRHLYDRPESAWSDDDVAGHIEAMCSELLRRFPHRRQGKATFTDAELWVAPATWERAVEMLVEASLLVHREAQPPHAEGTVPINLTVAGFRMGDER